MKKFLIISLTALFVAALVPQPAAAAVGVKGGLGLSKLSFTGEDVPPLVNLRAPVGGIFFGFGMGPISIQPEVLYVRIGARMEEGENWLEERFDCIQVPLLLKVNVMPGPISPMIFGGPYGAYRLTAKEVSYIDGVREEYDVKEDSVAFDYGVAFGGGLDFNLAALKLTAEVRYNLGLANLAKDPEPGFSVKNRTLMFLVGIGF
jgi:hypothetical protein